MKYSHVNAGPQLCVCWCGRIHKWGRAASVELPACYVPGPIPGCQSLPLTKLDMLRMPVLLMGQQIPVLFPAHLVCQRGALQLVICHSLPIYCASQHASNTTSACHVNCLACKRMGLVLCTDNLKLTMNHRS